MSKVERLRMKLIWAWRWLDLSLYVCHTLVSLFSSETALIVSVSSFSWSRHWLSSSWASYRWTGKVKHSLNIGSMRGQIKVPLWATYAILGYGYVRDTTTQCHNFSRGLYLRWSTSNIWCILDIIPYSRKLLRKKTFTNWWNLRFSQRKRSQIAHFSHAKGHHAPKFHGETFTSSHKTVKFVKVFSLQSFLLNSIQDGVLLTFGAFWKL